MIQPNQASGVLDREKAFKVTVRTPSQIPHEFEVRPDELVSHLIREAVTYFKAHGQLQPGKYDLALIRDDQAIELADTGRLEDYDVKPHDVLSLMPEEPEVDG